MGAKKAQGPCSPRPWGEPQTETSGCCFDLLGTVARATINMKMIEDAQHRMKTCAMAVSSSRESVGDRKRKSHRLL